MSAGRFVITKYESASGGIQAARVQPETLAATLGGVANAAPEGDITIPGKANVRGGRRTNGITCRKVRLTLADDDGNNAPDGYSGDPLYLPVMTTAIYDAVELGTAVNYLGVAWVVASLVPEYIN